MLVQHLSAVRAVSAASGAARLARDHSARFRRRTALRDSQMAQASFRDPAQAAARSSPQNRGQHCGKVIGPHEGWFGAECQCGQAPGDALRGAHGAGTRAPGKIRGSRNAMS
jgi:hypothetical protein